MLYGSVPDGFGITPNDGDKPAPIGLAVGRGFFNGCAIEATMTVSESDAPDQIVATFQLHAEAPNVGSNRISCKAKGSNTSRVTCVTGTPSERTGSAISITFNAEE